MSQSTPKANSRKPTLAVGTRVRAFGAEGVIVGVRRPKFARRYYVEIDRSDWDELMLWQRDWFEVLG